eukprot:124293_1
MLQHQSCPPTLTLYSPLNTFYNQSYPPISMTNTHNNSNRNQLFPPPIINTNDLTQQNSTINTNGLTSVSVFPTQICSNISPSNISPSYSPMNSIGIPPDFGVNNNIIQGNHTEYHAYQNSNINSGGVINGNNSMSNNIFNVINNPIMDSTNTNS